MLVSWVAHRVQQRGSSTAGIFRQRAVGQAGTPPPCVGCLLFFLSCCSSFLGPYFPVASIPVSLPRCKPFHREVSVGVPLLDRPPPARKGGPSPGPHQSPGNQFRGVHMPITLKVKASACTVSVEVAKLCLCQEPGRTSPVVQGGPKVCMASCGEHGRTWESPA